MLKPLDFSPIKNLSKVSHNIYYHKQYHHAHNFDSGEVHRFTEMGVENTGYITTFVVTLGFVTHCL